MASLQKKQKTRRVPSHKAPERKIETHTHTHILHPQNEKPSQNGDKATRQPQEGSLGPARCQLFLPSFGRVFVYYNIQKEVDTLILTSLLEDLEEKHKHIPSIIVKNIVYFPLLVLKAIYHYWIYFLNLSGDKHTNGGNSPW